MSDQGSPGRPWQWLLLLSVFGLNFWLYVPKNEYQVSYPWFLQQVENDNIKRISIRGTEIHGELRTPERYRNRPLVDTTIKKFYTFGQTEESIEPTIQKLIERDKKKETSPVLIEVQPPR